MNIKSEFNNMTKQTLLIALMLSCLSIFGQDTLTFDSYIQTKDSALTGNGNSPVYRIFQSSGVSFSSRNDTNFNGGWSWSTGIAVTSMTDTMNGTFTNLLSSANGKGANNSLAYGMYSRRGGFKTLPTTGGMPLFVSMDVTNSFYAYEIIKNGNMFSQKFTAANKDSFVLWVHFHRGTNPLYDSIRVDLANFTFADTTKNYVQKEWKTVSLGNILADSISFHLVSSDNGSFGMNTPNFFAMDNLVIDYINSVDRVRFRQLVLYPNPTSGIVNVNFDNLKRIDILNTVGAVVKSINTDRLIDLTQFESGAYFFKSYFKNGSIETFKVVKQ